PARTDTQPAPPNLVSKIRNLARRTLEIDGCDPSILRLQLEILNQRPWIMFDKGTSRRERLSARELRSLSTDLHNIGARVQRLNESVDALPSAALAIPRFIDLPSALRSCALWIDVIRHVRVH